MQESVAFRWISPGVQIAAESAAGVGTPVSVAHDAPTAPRGRTAGAVWSLTGALSSPATGGAADNAQACDGHLRDHQERSGEATTGAKGAAGGGEDERQ